MLGLVVLTLFHTCNVLSEPRSNYGVDLTKPDFADLKRVMTFYLKAGWSYGQISGNELVCGPPINAITVVLALRRSCIPMQTPTSKQGNKILHTKLYRIQNMILQKLAASLATVCDERTFRYPLPNQRDN
ncbi:hypothetical protein V8F20_010751 [Naviculisporaceae sp. PSN 640]